MSQSTGVNGSPIRWHKTRTATGTALRCRQQCDADSTAMQTWPASDDSVPMSDSKRPSPSWTLLHTWIVSGCRVTVSRSRRAVEAIEDTGGQLGQGGDLLWRHALEKEAANRVDVSGCGSIDGVATGFGEHDVGTAPIRSALLAGDQFAALHPAEVVGQSPRLPFEGSL